MPGSQNQEVGIPLLNMNTQSKALEAALAGERTHFTIAAVQTGDPQTDLISLCLSAVEALHLPHGGAAMVFEYLAKRCNAMADWETKNPSLSGLGHAIASHDVSELVRLKAKASGMQNQGASGSGISLSSTPLPSPTKLPPLSSEELDWLREVLVDPAVEELRKLSLRDLDSSCGD